MSKSNSNNAANSTSVTTVPEWDELPCVQYGFPDGKGPTRAPRLRTIFEPVPDGATTASPMYKLTAEQYKRQATRDNPYNVKGYTSIATQLQAQCEADNRVLYPIHVESDELRVEGADTLIEWFREFVEDYLGVPFDTCQRYFSGNRSIHVHVPRFVSGESGRKQLRSQAETFCEETGGKLDCGLYYAKRMFRLPGVEHEKTEIPKLEIDGVWDNARLAQKVKNASPSPPATYAEVLQHVFLSQESLTVASAHSERDNPLALFQVLDSEKTILDSSETLETPLIEQKNYPDDDANVIRWLQYNAKEFSPYALASGDSRSVAVLKVKGSPFGREKVRIGNGSRPVHALVPAYFYGARGCAGEEFTKDHEHAPLQLSKRDYGKWEYETGDDVVIIGGKSHQSRIFTVTSWQATVLGHALTGEDASRRDALDYLESEGYDVGKAGSSGKATVNQETPSPQKRSSTGTSKSEAATLQQKAEREGIEVLTHKERGQVACRLLRQGWEPAWKWFRTQFGADFKPEVTRNQFQSIIKSYPEDYDYVEIPSKPR